MPDESHRQRITITRINCPHVEKRIEEAGENAGWALAGQEDGLIVYLDPDKTTSLQLCPTCSALVRDRILSDVAQQALRTAMRDGMRRVFHA